MKSFLGVLVLLLSFQSVAGYNVLIDEIEHNSVAVDLRRDGVIRFSDQQGNNFFLLCENYLFHKNMVFSSFGQRISAEGPGCRNFIEGVKSNLEQGKTLESLEVQVNGERGRANEMFFQPHYN
jgi:hypothetical protein